MTQSDALDILKTGANVFLTGPAGSGKTYVLREYLKCLRDRDIAVGITASTGIAATHMGGMTIHSWSGVGVRDTLSDQDLEEIAEKSYVKSKVEAAKVLVIDEISMLHHFRLDLVSQILQKIRKSDAPFGGLQVVVCGDFFQLPPVSRGGEPDAYFAYHSLSWKEAQFTVCYLEEQHRQTDKEYIRILNAIRAQAISPDMMKLLEGRIIVSTKDSYNRNDDGLDYITDEHVGYDEDTIMIGGDALDLLDQSHSNNSSKVLHGKEGTFSGDVTVHLNETKTVSDIKTATPPENDSHQDKINISLNEKIKPTRLYSHNSDVDAENERELSAVQGNSMEYKMISHGNKKLIEGLKKSCLAPEILRLKKGAQVMFVKNNRELGYANGTRGTVVECSYDHIIVKTFDGRDIDVSRESWHIEEGDKVLAEIEQYPLRLAWAITIHKSQGMSLDAAHIDLSRSFEKGMGYVALSRVRSLVGLTLAGLNAMALEIHPEAFEFDRYFRELSKQAETSLMTLPKDELKKKQRRFIGPDPAIKDDGETESQFAERIRVSKIHKLKQKIKKEKIPSTTVTRSLIDARKSIKEVAAERGLSFDTILGHVEEIKSADPTWNISHLRDTLPVTRFKKISMAFHSVGVQEGGGRPLTPVKQILGGSFTFEEIRLVRLFLWAHPPQEIRSPRRSNLL
jgi:PIF1-like helicase/Helix-turn-helix domain